MKNDTEKAIKLLSDLINTPSFSKEEHSTRDLIEQFLENNGAEYGAVGNNVYASTRDFDETKPTLLLNSHHDTVRPNHGYTRDPYQAEVTEGKLFGLGSNDAGASLVCLALTFLYFYKQENLPVNILFAASAEEEISGKNGIELLLKHLPKIDFGIVGEPTSGEVSIAEKGLLVLDCVTHGISGHAARKEGKNAIYEALDDIIWFREFEFPEESSFLGPISMNVTMIESGTQHNVVPDICKFTVDVRTTDAYTLEETLGIIRNNVSATVEPRSVRLKPSYIEDDHLLRQAVSMLGLKTFGSPTLSDQALMPFPTIKIGPGDSSRSHSADEFVYIKQIEEGFETYRKIIEQVFKNVKTS